jgi:hypothetical protein
MITLLMASACADDPAEPRIPDREEGPTSAATIVPVPTCTKSWASATGGLWLDPSRWTPLGVPSITDHVCIDAPGTYDVFHSLPIMVQSLRIGCTGANVDFEFDPPFGVDIIADEGIWIESGGTLTVLSEGEAGLTAGAGPLIVNGELDIENSCACGGDVARLQFTSIDNRGRMELEAPITIDLTVYPWENRTEGVVVTSGTGIIDVINSRLLLPCGTIVGSTQIHVTNLYWCHGMIGSISTAHSVVYYDIAYAGVFRLVPLSGPSGRCGEVFTPIKHGLNPATGKFGVYAGLSLPPKSSWRVQTMPDSVVLAGYDPLAQTISVTKAAAAVSEGGTSDQYKVCLGPTTPTSNVIVVPTALASQLVNPAPILFNQATWKLPKTITLSASTIRSSNQRTRIQCDMCSAARRPPTTESPRNTPLSRSPTTMVTLSSIHRPERAGIDTRGLRVRSRVSRDEPWTDTFDGRNADRRSAGRFQCSVPAGVRRNVQRGRCRRSHL